MLRLLWERCSAFRRSQLYRLYFIGLLGIISSTVLPMCIFILFLLWYKCPDSRPNTLRKMRSFLICACCSLIWMGKQIKHNKRYFRWSTFSDIKRKQWIRECAWTGYPSLFVVCLCRKGENGAVYMTLSKNTRARLWLGFLYIFFPELFLWL